MVLYRKRSSVEARFRARSRSRRLIVKTWFSFFFTSHKKGAAPIYAIIRGRDVFYLAIGASDEG